VNYFTSFGLSLDAPMQPSLHEHGGKGAGLLWMNSNQIPVPPGFVIGTSICKSYFSSKESTATYVRKYMKPNLAALKTKFGYMPLVSVRSGARVSMPGMMDTILNVGLDAESYPFWAEKLGVEAASDSYCRLIEMFGSVVKGIERKKFEGLGLAERFALYRAETGEDFPNAEEQIYQSVFAVFDSWNNERAKTYRKAHSLSDSWGTACVIQSMVFGNLNDRSGTGVLFTRNPDTGENKIVGEFLTKAQGEDVVAGIRTPIPLSKLAEWDASVAASLQKIVTKMEALKRDVQDVEFTIQDGQLFILQTRDAKRSARAAVRIALDMHQAGMIARGEVFSRVSASQYDRLTMDVIDPSFTKEPNWTGIPACNGVVTGRVVLTPQAAIDCSEPCILVREETCPDDIAGMIAAKGVLTMTGGATSHAAVVARAMDKPCVVGLGVTEKKMYESMFKEGMVISIDGATGRVWTCEVPVVSGASDTLVKEFEAFAFGVLTNVATSTPEKYTACLDLSDRWLAPASEVADLILAQWALTPKGFVLDMIPDEASSALYSIMGSEGFNTKMEQIDQLLPEGMKNVTFFGPVVSKKMSSVSRASTLEELVLVKSKYCFSGKESEAVSQVMKWLEEKGMPRLSDDLDSFQTSCFCLLRSWMNA
jgi:pyruvate,orthophosphate dikinase